MKKTIIYFAFLLCTFSLQLQAQPGRGGRMRERVESMKIGFITERLQLGSEEAQRFWPVYNRYADEMRKLRENAKGALRDDMAELPLMTDADADKMLTDMVNFKVSESEIIKRYAAEFKKVLPVKKVALLFKAEFDFKKELLNRLRDRGDMREPGMR